jgi:hypothetical protein
MTISDVLGFILSLGLLIIVAFPFVFPSLRDYYFLLTSPYLIRYYSVTVYGYGRLLAKYPYESSWEGESFVFANVCLDSKYINDRGLSMAVNSQAIYMHRLWDKAADGVLIPWTEIGLSSTSRYRNSPGLSLSIGDPVIAKLYLPAVVVWRIQKYVPARLFNRPVDK